MDEIIKAKTPPMTPIQKYGIFVFLFAILGFLFLFGVPNHALFYLHINLLYFFKGMGFAGQWLVLAIIPVFIAFVAIVIDVIIHRRQSCWDITGRLFLVILLFSVVCCQGLSVFGSLLTPHTPSATLTINNHTYHLIQIHLQYDGTLYDLYRCQEDGYMCHYLETYFTRYHDNTASVPLEYSERENVLYIHIVDETHEYHLPNN